MDELLKKSDVLEEEHKYEEMWELLFNECSEKDLENDLLIQLLWRKARACYERHANIVKSPAEKEAAVRQGLALAERVEKLNPDHPAGPKWAAILLSELGEFTSTKEKISNAWVIKHRFDRAHQLDPKDVTVMYCLGVWCYEVASIGWMTRKIAQALFDEVPTATYEESRIWFEEALKASNDKPSKRLALAMGKTLWAEGKKDEAKIFFKKTLDLPTLDKDDAKMDAEAIKY